MPSDFRYNQLFYRYTTSEGIPFTLKNRSVNFPEDPSNPIYQIKYISTDTPWTILSNTIYGTIDYWWVLCLLNQSDVFYAKESSEIRVIDPDYIEDIIATIRSQLDT